MYVIKIFMGAMRIKNQIQIRIVLRIEIYDMM